MLIISGEADDAKIAYITCRIWVYMAFFFNCRDDDDINDVASMAGVNLNEESARIMATNSDLVGTQMQSCKDEPFLAAVPLHKRILETGEKHILSSWERFLQRDEVLRNTICLALKMAF